jgi:DNA-binding MarR family transcriptional regulator
MKTPRQCCFSGSLLLGRIYQEIYFARVTEDAPDHIDRIIAQWRRERPDLNTEPMETLGRLFRTAYLADAALTKPLSGYGVQPGWFDLLAALRRAGAPYELNPTTLRHATMLSSGGMTKRLDRLAGAGLIERRPDPADRRGTLVRLTRKGKTLIDKAVETHLANEKRLLVALEPDDQRTLDHLLRALLASLEPSEDGR